MINLFNKADEEEQRNRVFGWAAKTETGYRSDLPFEVMPQVWEEMGRQKDLCLGKSCKTHSSCFYFKARKKWFGAHLLIVNHHLFFANVANLQNFTRPRSVFSVVDDVLDLLTSLDVR